MWLLWQQAPQCQHAPLRPPQLIGGPPQPEHGHGPDHEHGSLEQNEARLREVDTLLPVGTTAVAWTAPRTSQLHFSCPSAVTFAGQGTPRAPCLLALTAAAGGFGAAAVADQGGAQATRHASNVAPQRQPSLGASCLANTEGDGPTTPATHLEADNQTGQPVPWARGLLPVPVPVPGCPHPPRHKPLSGLPVLGQQPEVQPKHN
mmetsp:Transcript_56855/g.166455  ORF Transcript_56855/g.166455 Transcript_56855/m.166455 type:complete len:204 (+) Transcript_56855:1739-2350(+)